MTQQYINILKNQTILEIKDLDNNKVILITKDLNNYINFYLLDDIIYPYLEPLNLIDLKNNFNYLDFLINILNELC